MTHLWEIIGLATLDRNFNKELREIKDDRKKLGEELQKYGYRLSAYELVELQRIISTKITGPPCTPPEDVLGLMEYIAGLLWVDFDFCWWAWWEGLIKPDTHPYHHPYLVFDEKTKKNVPGAVDPKTGEPINNENLETGEPINNENLVNEDTSGHHPSSPIPPKRFVKAKNHQKV